MANNVNKNRNTTWFQKIRFLRICLLWLGVQCTAPKRSTPILWIICDYFVYTNQSKCKGNEKEWKNSTYEHKNRILKFQDFCFCRLENTCAKFCTQREIQFFFQEIKVKTLTLIALKGFDEIQRLQKDMHKILTRQIVGFNSEWSKAFLDFPASTSALALFVNRALIPIDPSTCGGWSNYARNGFNTQTQGDIPRLL